MIKVMTLICFAIGLFIIGVGCSLVFGPAQITMWSDFLMRISGLFVAVFGAVVVVESLDNY